MLSAYEFIFIAFFGLIPFTLLVVCIADLMNREFTMWEKVLWMFFIVFFIIIGPIIYLITNKGVFSSNVEKHLKDPTIL